MICILCYYNPVLSLCKVLEVYLVHRIPPTERGWHLYTGNFPGVLTAGRWWVDVWGGNKAHSHSEFAANVVLLKLIHRRFTELGEKCIGFMYFGITDSCMLPTKTLKVFLWVYMYTRNKKITFPKLYYTYVHKRLLLFFTLYILRIYENSTLNEI